MLEDETSWHNTLNLSKVTKVTVGKDVYQLKFHVNMTSTKVVSNFGCAIGMRHSKGYFGANYVDYYAEFNEIMGILLQCMGTI